MARTFQIKRGAKSNMPTLAQGELGFTTDSNAEELYIGNGSENIQIARQDYVDSAAAAVKDDLLNGAGEAYDTLKELGDLINENQDALEALETVASTQSDWNENNSESKAYVKNRTHYTFYGKTLSYDPMRGGYVELNDAVFVNGCCHYTEAAGGWPESLTDGGLTYWFILDGVEYECTSEKFEKVNDEGEAYTEYVLGGADKGYPFRIVQEPVYGFTVYICDEEGLGETTTTHSFALYEPGEEVVKLDNKYLNIANEVTIGETRPVSGEAVRGAILDSGVGVVEEYNGDLVTGHTVWEAINNAVVQSDWNENDETSKAYVQNRPFYSDVGYSIAKSSISGTEMIDIELDSMSADGRYYFSHVMGSDEDSGLCGMFYYEGRDYRVVWDGVEYECTAYWNDEESYFGLGGDGLPFKFEHIGNVVYAYAYDSNGNLLLDSDSHIFSAYEKGEVVVKIPEKYLPDTIYDTLETIANGKSSVTIKHWTAADVQ